MAQPRRYRAFISYSHKDNVAGNRLFKYLDGYRPPRALIGRDTPFGPVPAKLYPIFRDREELACSPALAGRLQAALNASEHLVVICSPDAAASQWVNEEIRMFQRSGRGNRIHAVLVAGEPAVSFPPALTSAEGDKPLATDLRKEGDGWTDGPLKVAAGILGLSFGELKDRDVARARVRARVRASIIAAMLLLTLLAVGGGVMWSWTARDSEKLLAEAIKKAAADVGGAVRFADRIGVSRDLTEDMLRTTERGLDMVYGIAIGSPWLPWQKRAALQPLVAGRAELLMVYADHYGTIGRTDRQLETAERALVTLADVARQDPENVKWQRQLAMNHDLLGSVRATRGNTVQALASFQSALVIREQLAQAQPEDDRLQRDVSLSYSHIGDILRRHGRPTEALSAYRAALAVAERLLASSPGNAELQRDVLVGNHKLGDMLLKQEDLDAVAPAYRQALAIAVRLAAADPNHLQAQRDLSISHDKVGDLLYRQHQLQAALSSYEASAAIAERLAAAVPEEVAVHRDLALSFDNIGDVRLRQGRAREALDSYSAARSIRQRLVNMDPGNALLDRDLSVSHNKIGHVLAAEPRPEAALQEYRAALVIRERLAAADPASAQLQRDLSTAHGNIARALETAGWLADAEAEHRVALAIAERIPAADPSSVEGWDVVFASARALGEMQERAGNTDAAGTAYCVARRAVLSVSSLGSEDPKWHKRLLWVEERFRVLASTGPSDC